MALRIYNTLSKTKELFEPVNPGKVGIYLCGPTVYRESHIGHIVGPVIFDALTRYLRFKGYQVTWVLNITDVDDKIIAEAERKNASIEQITQPLTEQYIQSLQKLGIDTVTIMPRATEHIGHMIKLVQKLLDNGAAYVVDGDVYFDITSRPDYGKLSHRRLEDQGQISRQCNTSGKRHAGDFVLWKKAKPGEPSWDSPWGKGRPGWHIECSAMSMAYLGETVDIHGGGMDLIFPHHENEIAQSEAATGKPFVKFWMHNGLTRINTKKMSKSTGLIRPIAELLEQHHPDVIRLFILSTHYRRPIDFSDEALERTKRAYESFQRLFERIERITSESVHAGGEAVHSLQQQVQSDIDKQLIEQCNADRLRFLEALDDDFNTAAAIAVLFEMVSRANAYIDKADLEVHARPEAAKLIVATGRTIVSLGEVLGLFRKPLAEASSQQDTEPFIRLLVETRLKARSMRQYELADAIREGLEKLGIVLEDLRDGTTKWRRK